jgi:hypothetical protein
MLKGQCVYVCVMCVCVVVVVVVVGRGGRVGTYSPTTWTDVPRLPVLPSTLILSFRNSIK